jgi:ATP-binding cassette subfamily F protein 3
MQPLRSADPSLSFDFPSPAKLRPPLMTLDMASVGYAPGQPVLTRLNLRIDPEDRIALLGRNGNGKTTLARLLSAQLTPMDGGMTAPGKLKVGYFTQYQVEELEGDSSPLEHMSRLMKGATPAAVRAQLGRFGFSGDKATRAVATMSGGERARLALALITRDAPHMLILDEPTNHLDVDAREALVQALNDYGGTVVLVSHDRHMIELTADRLVLVDHGTATEYAGSLDDYTDMILGRNGAGASSGGGSPGAAAKVSRKDERRAAADAREKSKALRTAAKAAEAEIARLEARRTEIDRAMFDPSSASAADAKLTMSALMKLRAEVSAKLEAAEARWLEASAQLEEAGLAA